MRWRRRTRPTPTTSPATPTPWWLSWTTLDADFSAGLETCERRTIVTSHAAFAYLAARYDLVQVPIAGLDPSNEPSPARAGRRHPAGARRGHHHGVHRGAGQPGHRAHRRQTRPAPRSRRSIRSRGSSDDTTRRDLPDPHAPQPRGAPYGKLLSMTASADPLVVEGVSVALDGRLVLHDVDLRVGAGEFVVLLGPTDLASRPSCGPRSGSSRRSAARCACSAPPAALPRAHPARLRSPAHPRRGRRPRHGARGRAERPPGPSPLVRPRAAGPTSLPSRPPSIASG